MNFSSFKLSVLTSCIVLLTACSQHGVSPSPVSSQPLTVDQPTAEKLQLREVDTNEAKTEDVQWLNLSTVRIKVFSF